MIPYHIQGNTRIAALGRRRTPPRISNARMAIDPGINAAMMKDA
jgi:hypothetical protein